MKSKKKAAALAGAVAVLAISGTFAYFTQTLTVTNEFDTGTYDTELVEKFKPSDGDDWEPGSKVDKNVTIKNNGSLPVVVRVKFTEIWDRGEGKEFYRVDTAEAVKEVITALDDTDEIKFEHVYQAYPSGKEDDPDGIAGTDANGDYVDDSVVYKTLNPDGGWIYNPLDGYYYYYRVLAGYQENADGTVTIDETKKLLDDVTLCENVDMGKYDVVKYYSTDVNTPSDASPIDAEDGSGWQTFDPNIDGKYGDGKYVSTKEMSDRLAKKEPPQTINFMKSETVIHKDEDGTEYKGYSDANYTLIITAQTVQATDQAVKSVFAYDEEHEFDYTILPGCKWELTVEGDDQTSESAAE